MTARMVLVAMRGLERRRLQFRMPEQDLDHPNVDVLLQKVGCKTMSKRVRRHAFGDLCHVCRRMAGAVELACRYRLQRILAREQPSLWVCDAPPKVARAEAPAAQATASRMDCLQPLPCSTRNIMH